LSLDVQFQLVFAGSYVLVTVPHMTIFRWFGRRGEPGFLRRFFVEPDPIVSPCVNNRFLLTLIGLVLVWSLPSGGKGSGPVIMPVLAGFLCGVAHVADWLRRRTEGGAS